MAKSATLDRLDSIGWLIDCELLYNLARLFRGD